MRSILKEWAYRKLVQAAKKLARAVRLRKRLGYDAIFGVIAKIDELMVARQSWEGY